MNVNRREILKSLGAVVGTGALSSGNTQSSKAKTQKHGRPNILVFLTDDHGQWLQQAYGNTEVQTPHMTSLARNGVRMNNAFTTTPVCSPARASFFTGRMPSQHGIHDWLGYEKESYAYPWLQDQVLISDLLKKVGYRTGLIGKWHCGHDREPHSGFDEWYSFWGDQYPHIGLQNISDNGKHVQIDGIQSSLFSDKAIEFLKNRHSEQPFFLFVGYTDTHWPHEGQPPELVTTYQDATFRDIPVEAFPKCHGLAYAPVYKEEVKERDRRAQYYAAASSVDRELGRVLEALTSMGEIDNTMIVYTGDHGLNGGQHGMWEKGNATSPQNFIEESIRIPCTISWPKGSIPCGLDSDLPVNHCDLWATILDAAGATPDAATAKLINSPGRSYLAALRGKQPETSWRNGVILEYGNARMARRDGYKLILRYSFRGQEWDNEFYDLRSDPRETVNLYPNPTPSQATAIADMTKRLNEYFAVYSISGRSGLDIESQPQANTSSVWLHKHH
jgi:arylsulfatase A-like enzyme